MQQISIYRNGVKFANVPVPKIGIIYLQNVAQVPSNVMYMIRNWAKGSEPKQVYGEWSWEWQRTGSPVTDAVRAVP